MQREIGAVYKKENICEFTVWAPFAKNVELVIKDQKKTYPLKENPRGYWQQTFSDIKPGSFYKFRLDQEKVFPDPASRFQPIDVHSWSGVIDPGAFKWSEGNWKGLPISEMIIYELHVGTFSPQGTFEGVLEKLGHLEELGVTTIELMPLSQFPGNRNWGYDGVYPFAVQNSYGGVEELKKLVNACHQRGMAILLDVVYNHMGPEGNYLREFGPYFTEKYQTPWGSALNFDDEYSDEVRNFFIRNALMWLEDFHFDGLRLDAIHEIIDRSAFHFLKELNLAVDTLEEKTGRSYTIIAETDLNDSRIITPYEQGGFQLEGQWADDFHHSLHTLLTGEKSGYYSDYGNLSYLEKSFRQALVYDGTYSNFRKRRIGNSPSGIPSSKFVVCIQNHDQVGNRMMGERLSTLISFEAIKLATAALLVSPFVPLIFMGEEFAEDRPFQYFVSHGDMDLVKAVQEGRKKEFEYFFRHHKGKFPDPQAEETFIHSKLNWGFLQNPEKKIFFEFYKYLLQLRKNGSFSPFRKEIPATKINEDTRCLYIWQENQEKKLCAVLNFSTETQKILLPEISAPWKLLLATASERWGGSLSYPQKFNKEVAELPPASLIICES